MDPRAFASGSHAGGFAANAAVPVPTRTPTARARAAAPAPTALRRIFIEDSFWSAVGEAQVGIAGHQPRGGDERSVRGASDPARRAGEQRLYPVLGAADLPREREPADRCGRRDVPLTHEDVQATSGAVRPGAGQQLDDVLAARAAVPGVEYGRTANRHRRDRVGVVLDERRVMLLHGADTRAERDRGATVGSLQVGEEEVARPRAG